MLDPQESQDEVPAGEPEHADATLGEGLDAATLTGSTQQAESDEMSSQSSASSDGAAITTADQPTETRSGGLFGKSTRSSSTAASSEATPGMAERQNESRSEIQDFLRVLNNLAGPNLPQFLVDHITVTGDMHMGARASGEIYPPPQRDSADVSPAEIAKVRAVFQRPAAYPKALRLLCEQHSVVLVGRPGIGKRCAAIRLACELQGDSAEVAIRELSADSDLAQQIQALASQPRVAYLVDDLLVSQGRALKPIAARMMLDTLRKQGCYLIICARPNVYLPRDLESVALEAPPISTAAMVELHLTYYESFSPEEIRDALTQEDIAAILNAGLSPALADRLAAQLATVLRAGRPPHDAVRGFVAATADDVRKWFDEAEDDLALRCIRIALAVFNGARFDPLYSAAKTLETALQPPSSEESEEKKPAPSPFQRKQSDLLVGAQSVRRPMPTYYSDRAMVEVVELEDPNYSPALLEYLWEHPGLREPLLSWLMRYATDAHAPQEIRLRAAAAIGALAGFDFDTIQAKALRPWAFGEVGSNDERRRRYAALSNALGMLIWNDDCADIVRDLLQAWLEEGNDSARWAAARAYAQVGLRYPREAMNQWRRILESKGKIELRLTESFGFVIPHPLHMSVVDAIVSLFLRAVELPHRLRPVYEQALEGLAAWVEADSADPNAEQVGLPLFVALTAIRLPPDSGEGDPEQWSPAMLTIVGTQPDSTYRRILAGLFHRSVLQPRLQQQTIVALRSWAEAAENDPWLEQTLGAVLSEWMALPGASQRERGILRMHLSRWANHPKEPLTVAGRLLTLPKLV